MRKPGKATRRPIPVRPPLQRGPNQALARLFSRRVAELELSVRDLGKRLGKPTTTVHKTLRGQRRLDPFEFLDWCEALELEDPIEALRLILRRG